MAVFLTCLTPFFTRGTKGFVVADNLSLNTDESILDFGLFKFALPNYDDEPAFGLKLSPRLLIAFLVAGDFIYPELGIGLWGGVLDAFIVAMPETTVNKNRSMILRQI